MSGIWRSGVHAAAMQQSVWMQSIGIESPVFTSRKKEPFVNVTRHHCKAAFQNNRADKEYMI